MEVENGPQKETKLIFQGPTFDFHDCGRKGIQSRKAFEDFHLRHIQSNMEKTLGQTVNMLTLIFISGVFSRPTVAHPNFIILNLYE